MKQGKYEYKQKCVEQIVARKFTFDFPEDLDPCWIPGNRVRSHLFNGLSIPMPYLEPFLMKTVTEARRQVTDPALISDMKMFTQQEGHHYKCHRQLNELLKANGYPEFSRIEQRLTDDYARLSKRTLCRRLAYCAGFESMTNGFTTWLIRKRVDLFFGAAPHITSFWLMHMVEETEHKTVAFDAFMACSGRYFPRIIGVLHGSFHVLGIGVRGMIYALRKDNVLYKGRTILSMIRELSSLAFHVGPFLLRALIPGYDPRNEHDPQWMKDWVAGYANLPAGESLPLIDTADPAMPIPFEPAA